MTPFRVTLSHRIKVKVTMSKRSFFYLKGFKQKNKHIKYASRSKFIPESFWQGWSCIPRRTDVQTNGQVKTISFQIIYAQGCILVREFYTAKMLSRKGLVWMHKRKKKIVSVSMIKRTTDLWVFSKKRRSKYNKTKQKQKHFKLVKFKRKHFSAKNKTKTKKHTHTKQNTKQKQTKKTTSN